MGSALHRLLLLPSALLVSTISFVFATESHLAPRQSSANASAAPLSVDADQGWAGIDGNWSTIALRVGSPAQDVRVLVSFNLYQTWVVAPPGCSSAASPTSCAASRGGIFDPSNSTTWELIGIYGFAIEQNLGYDGNAEFGYDAVGLGGVSQDLPVVQNTTVGAFAVDDFYLGLLGLNPKPTNFTSNYNIGSPSYMTLLKRQGFIPSVSFGFTAGASYRSAPSSLTLGGYDHSRFRDNNITFNFAGDNERDTVVVLQQISTPSRQSSSPTGTSLLPNAIYIFLDSSVPEIWLPLEACRAFESEFGLVFDNSTELYLVDDALHQSLLTRNASISFLLAQNATSGQTVAVTLPYAAFDQTASPPFSSLTNTSRYFPLRRAQNQTQYTLGRTFLQEAYISVDYESETFNVSQALFPQDFAMKNITAIPPYAGKNPGPYSGGGNSTSSNNLSGGAIAGIVIGAVAALALLALVLVWFFCRRHAAFAKDNEKDKLIVVPNPSSNDGNAPFVYPKAELEGSTAFPPLSGSDENSAAAGGHMLSAPGSSNGHSRSPVSPVAPGSGAGGNAGSTTAAFLRNQHRHRPNRDSQTSYPSADSGSTPPLGEGTHSSTYSAVALYAAGLAPSLSQSSESTTHGAGAREEQQRVLVHEMPGDFPTIDEKDGHALTPKEADRLREQKYNGVDAEPATPVAPSPVAAARWRPAAVSANPVRPATAAAAAENIKPDAHGFRFNFDRVSAGSSARRSSLLESGGGNRHRRSLAGDGGADPPARDVAPAVPPRSPQRVSGLASTSASEHRPRPSSEIARPGMIGGGGGYVGQDERLRVGGQQGLLHRQFSFERDSSESQDEELYR